MMKRAAFLFLLLTTIPATNAWAGQAEVRDAAIANNCPPKKIEVYQQSLGMGGETIYRVQCTLPKTVGEATGPVPDTVMVSCVQNLCSLSNTLVGEKK